MTKVGQTKTDTAETCLWCVGERLSGGRVAEQPAWRIGGRNWCGDLPGVQKYVCTCEVPSPVARVSPRRFSTASVWLACCGLLPALAAALARQGRSVLESCWPSHGVVLEPLIPDGLCSVFDGPDSLPLGQGLRLTLC